MAKFLLSTDNLNPGPDGFEYSANVHGVDGRSTMLALRRRDAGNPYAATIIKPLFDTVSGIALAAANTLERLQPGAAQEVIRGFMKDRAAGLVFKTHDLLVNARLDRRHKAATAQRTDMPGDTSAPALTAEQRAADASARTIRHGEIIRAMGGPGRTEAENLSWALREGRLITQEFDELSAIVDAGPGATNIAPTAWHRVEEAFFIAKHVMGQRGNRLAFPPMSAAHIASIDVVPSVRAEALTAWRALTDMSDIEVAEGFVGQALEFLAIVGGFTGADAVIAHLEINKP